jgi:hypothetical protein
MSITIVQGKPAKSHNGEAYSTRRMGKVIPLIDRTWNELTKAQQSSVLFGDGCGHPSNRPKSSAQARKWIYTVRTDTGTIYGHNPGWGFAL